MSWFTKKSQLEEKLVERYTIDYEYTGDRGQPCESRYKDTKVYYEEEHGNLVESLEHILKTKGGDTTIENVHIEHRVIKFSGEHEIKLFSKDECAPDALSLARFKWDNKIEDDHFYTKITIDYWDGSTIYFVGIDRKFYIEEHSCGVYEELYSCDNEEEYQSHMKKSLVEYCKLTFLKS